MATRKFKLTIETEEKEQATVDFVYNEDDETFESEMEGDVEMALEILDLLTGFTYDWMDVESVAGTA